jgi:cyanate permease
LFYVPLVFFFIRNSPQSHGLEPDGLVYDLQKPTKQKIVGKPIIEVNEKSWTLNEALKTFSFWGVLFCIAVPAMVNTGMTFHIVSILGEQGITRGEASFVLSMMALVAFPLSFLAGVILDRVSLHKVFAITFVVEAIAILVLLLGDSYSSALLFGLLRGVAAGFGTICLALIIPNFFGTAHLGSLKGVGVTSTVLASALGPLPFGVAYDLFGGYTEILLLMLLFPLLATVVAWFNKGPISPVKV